MDSESWDPGFSLLESEVTDSHAQGKDLNKP